MFGDILESALDLIDESNLRYGQMAENAAPFYFSWISLQKMKLSKIARFMANQFDLPDPVGKIIGIYLGKDIALLPGDCFSKLSNLGDKQSDFRNVLFPHQSCFRISHGLSIKRYRVVRLTACFAHLLLVSEHRLYRATTWGGGGPAPVLVTDYFFWREFYDYTCRYGITFCQNDIIFPQTVRDMATAIKIADFSDIMYDRQIQRLVHIEYSSLLRR